ncbi:YadA C-terminal domain-containing protein [Vibrio superstes]|nr:YadA C-terminal domain-containing protein [Vibrio superstes]
MKFTKTALTLALVAASGSVMAENAELPVLPKGQQIVEAFNNNTETTGYEIVVTENGYMQIQKDGVNQGAIAMFDEATGEWVQGTNQEANALVMKKEIVKHKLAGGPSVPTNPNNPTMPIEEDDTIIIDPIDPGFGVGPVPTERISEVAKRVDHAADSAKSHVEDIIADMTGADMLAEVTKRANEHGYDVAYNEESGELTFSTVTTDGGKEVVIDKNTFHTKVDNRREEMAEKSAERNTRREEAKTPVGAPTPIEGEKPVPSEGQEIVQGLKEARAIIAQTYTGEQANDAYNATQAQMDEIYAQGQANSQDIETLFGEVDRLDERIDGVMASAQAVTAARPYLSTNQTNSVGVGVGYAGDVAAVAVGYAHRINPNWTANANVSATTGNDVDVSAGAGVSYAW